MNGMTYLLIAIAYLLVSMLVTYALFSKAGEDHHDSTERT